MGENALRLHEAGISHCYAGIMRIIDGELRTECGHGPTHAIAAAKELPEGGYQCQRGVSRIPNTPLEWLNLMDGKTSTLQEAADRLATWHYHHHQNCRMAVEAHQK